MAESIRKAKVSIQSHVNYTIQKKFFYPSSVTLRIKEVRNNPRLSRIIKWLELIHCIN